MEPHILYVDDHTDTCELVRILLGAAGFRVSVTNNSFEAMRRVKQERFDAVLLDNWMPELDGIEVCRQIREFDQTTPILFCSGALTKADFDAALCAGAQGYLAKPFQPDELVQRLDALLAEAPVS